MYRIDSSSGSAKVNKLKMPFYTETGQYIRKPEAYANTGAPMF